MNKALLVVVTCLMLVSCANVDTKHFNGLVDSPKKKISNIRPIGFRLEKMPKPEVDTEEAIRRYERFLTLAPDGDTRVHVMHRLADLKLMDVEDLLAEDSEHLDVQHIQQVYEQTIQTYKRVLDLFPNRYDSDMLLYQLSKVYMLIGQEKQALAHLNRLVRDFPNSPLLLEVQYRRGDILFNQESYDQAEKAFSYVIKQKHKTNFYLSAQYMLGWSTYKQHNYEKSIMAFIGVIDERFSNTAAIVTANKGDKELLDDTLRVLSMIFANGDGFKQIARLIQTIGNKHYEYILYDSLAKHYLSKQQYSDAAKTYLGFVEENPTDVLAPTFYANVVTSYAAAGYQELVLSHKAKYVNNYGIHSAFWNIYGEDIRESIRPEIKQYTKQLAQYHHHKGQNSNSLNTKFNHLLLANHWYQNYIDTFKSDQLLGEIYFLQGEALYELGRYEQSIYAYTQGGYETPDHNQSSTSAYSALLAYNQVISKKENQEKALWIERKVKSALRFSDAFPNHHHVAQVLARAAEGLFDIGQFSRAVEVSDRVLLRPDVSKKQYSVALLINAHSHYDLKKYALAELAYKKVLDEANIEESKTSLIREKLAASIYKQGVESIETNKLIEAVEHFMRVGEVVPESPISATAHYDAAAYLMKSQNWLEAQTLLLNFREKYPVHALVEDIPSKLIIAYENLGQWNKAAFELQNIWRFSKNTNQQRIALFQSAQYYEKSGDIDNAMVMLKRYAHNYPKPFDAQLEAMSKLESAYHIKGDHEKRRFWLNKLILADQTSGSERSDRSQYLAANAQFQLANYERKEYSKIQLTLPLKHSLAKKKTALKRTLAAYQATAKLEVQEFTTAATYHIAEIYGELSRDLMASQRPAGLDELELEEYEFLLEDQAFPFEEAAINIHETNIKRSWDGLYDQWIKNSITSLAVLMPARYKKKEVSYDAIAEIH